MSTSLEQFRAARLARLTARHGFLSVVALVWLNEVDGPRKRKRTTTPLFVIHDEFGIETIAKSPPSDTTAGCIALGEISVVAAQEGKAQLVLYEQAQYAVSLDGLPITERCQLSTASLLTIGPLVISLLDRSGTLGLRAKNPAAHRRATFRGLDFFPPNPDWSVTATLTLQPTPHPVLQMPTAIPGISEPMTVPAKLSFEVAGKRHELSLLADGDDPDLLCIFRDGTSGVETYGAGRYLYIKKWTREEQSKERQAQGDDKSWQVDVDFNRCFVPPCAFIPFATCARAPKGNTLAVRVEAGEKGELPE